MKQSKNKKENSFVEIAHKLYSRLREEFSRIDRFWYRNLYRWARAWITTSEFKVFLVCLCLSLVFWFFIKLSKNYVSQIILEVEPVQAQMDEYIRSDEKEVMLQIEGFGFRLFFSQLTGGLHTELPLNTLPKINDTTYYWLTKSASTFFDNIYVRNVSPDTLFFSIEKNVSKTVPVVFDGEIDVENSYQMKKQVSIEPDSITVSGPRTKVQSISAIYTERAEYEDVSMSIEEVLELVIPFDSLTCEPSIVKMQAEVRQYTQLQMTIPILINDDEMKYETRIYPTEAHITFEVDVADAGLIEATQFAIVCEVDSQTLNTSQSTLPLVLKKRPPYSIDNLVIEPKRVEYILRERSF